MQSVSSGQLLQVDAGQSASAEAQVQLGVRPRQAPIHRGVGCQRDRVDDDPAIRGIDADGARRQMVRAVARLQDLSRGPGANQRIHDRHHGQPEPPAVQPKHRRDHDNDAAGDDRETSALAQNGKRQDDSPWTST